MKTVIQIILVIAIVVLGFMIVESIMKPIRFNKEKDKRYEATIERLKDIRTAQTAYKSQYGKFTGSFDTLINFLKYDSFKVVFKKGELTDSLVDAGWTEKKALLAGLITRDTSRVSVKDSLFKQRSHIDSLRYVPYTGGKEFELAAGEIETGSRVKVQVFEAKVHNNVLLHGLDKQLRINFNDERQRIAKYAGLKVGSLEEATNNAGNWE